MNVYFVNPTYVKPEGWKPLLTYLKVKAAYSFIPKEELPDSLYSIIKPYLKASYSGQDMKKYADSCAYWLRAHFEKHIRLILDDYDNVDDIPKEDRIKKYSSQSALNNLRHLDESNCLILLNFKSYFDEQGRIEEPFLLLEGVRDRNLPTHITQYCLNILHKKHDHYQYHNQSAFIAFNEFFTKAYYFNKKSRKWWRYQLMLTRGGEENFMKNVRRGIKELAPNDFPPIIDEDGRRWFTPLITEEGDVHLKKLIKDAEKAEKEYEEELERNGYYDKSWAEEVDELNRAFWRECGEGGSNCESWPGWD